MHTGRGAPAAIRTVDLRAADGFLSTPDGNSIYIWGFAGEAGDRVQVPGPTIVAAQGDTVMVNLANSLPAPVSIRFPGQENVLAGPAGGSLAPVQPQYDAGGRLVSLTNFAPPGGSVTYQFTAARPGTYVYESGTNPHVQVAMGLYGALVVHPEGFGPGNRTAYGPGTDTEFDREYLLITGEIDPELHRSVQAGQPFDLGTYRPRYWTLNGRCAPDTMAPDNALHLPAQPYGAMVLAEPGERVLIRYANAGAGSYPMHPHGNHARVVALDGQLLRNGPADLSFLRFTVLLEPGQTYDTIFRWTGLGFTPAHPIPSVVPNRRNLVLGAGAGWTLWSGSPYLGVKDELPVGLTSYNAAGEYHFMLHSHSEVQLTNFGEFPGGLMTMIAIYPTGSLSAGVGALR